MGPVNNVQDPLNSVISVQIWIVNKVVGLVYNARNPLAGLCSRASQLRN